MKNSPSISSKATTAIVAFTILTIFIAFGLSIPFRKSLFNLSLHIIHDMQTYTQGPFLDVIHNFITFYAGTTGTFILMVLTYVLAFDKINVIVMIMYICINVYLMAFLKVIFVDPRPYIYPNLVANLEWKCQITYGFPSGHTWILLLFHEPVVTNVFGCGPFKVALLYSVLLAIFVPWAKMYLGSHSVDQLVNGLFYSFAFLVLYRYYFREKLFKLVSFMMNPDKRKTKFLIVSTIHLMLLIPPIILYQINMNYRDIDMWQFDKTYQTCPRDSNYDHKMSTQISDVAVGNIVIGYLYGFLLLNQHYGNQQNSIPTQKFLLGFWQFKVSKIRNFLIKKFLLYATSIVFTAGIIYLMVGFFMTDFYVTYLLKTTAWNVMIIIWIRVIPQISIRYNLIQQVPYQKQSMIEV